MILILRLIIINEIGDKIMNYPFIRCIGRNILELQWDDIKTNETKCTYGYLINNNIQWLPVMTKTDDKFINKEIIQFIDLLCEKIRQLEDENKELRMNLKISELNVN